MPTDRIDAEARARLRNGKIGFVFQSFNLIAEMSVAENVGLPLLYRKGVGKAEMKERVADALAKVNITARADHKPAQLSGGERQRVAVCRALINEPVLLLADEPTGNLDRKTADAVGTLLLELNRELGTALIIVTHAPELAAKLQRTLTLREGRLV